MGEVIPWRPRPIAVSAHPLAPDVSPANPKIAAAVSGLEEVVQGMTDAGLSHMQISIVLARNLNRQLGLAMPTADAADACRELLLKTT